MATYVYRCPDCGPWEVRLAMGTAGATAPCPACGGAAPRLYTPPLLSRTTAPVAAARLREEASRDEPAITTAIPRAADRAAPRDPRWQSLPRP
ncbi:MAG: zinc ribbon domain-containing protein [Blastococcus sp.]